MNSLFGQLVRDVKTKTNRPELDDQIQLAVRESTQFCHLMDFWKRDSFETLLQVNSAISFWNLSTTTLDRFRKFRYIKKFDLDSSLSKEGPDHEIKEISPAALFDAYERRKKNVYYLAGSNVNLNLSTTERGLLVCFYQYPVVDPNHYNSWIAAMYSVAITDHAAAKIFRNIGQTDDAAALEKTFLNVHVPTIQRQDVEASTD